MTALLTEAVVAAAAVVTGSATPADVLVICLVTAPMEVVVGDVVVALEAVAVVVAAAALATSVASLATLLASVRKLEIARAAAASDAALWDTWPATVQNQMRSKLQLSLHAPHISPVVCSPLYSQRQYYPYIPIYYLVYVERRVNIHGIYL